MEGNTDTPAHRQVERLVRLAWVLTFVVPLFLAALLLGVKSAQAAPSNVGTAPYALEEEPEEEGEFVEEECELAEVEFELGEISKSEADETCREAEAAQSAASPSRECPLRSARAHAAINKGRLKLTLGYTTVESVEATIQVSLGSTQIGSFKRHLGKSGVLRFTAKPRRKHAGRVLVRIMLPSDGGGCPSDRLVFFSH